MAPTIMAAAAIGGAAISYQQQRQAGQIAAQAHEFDAVRAEQEAEQIEKVSEHEERQTRVEGRRLRARQLLQFASGNVVPSTGTPLTVGERTAEEIEKDIRLKKYGFGVQVGQKKKEAQLQRIMGKTKTRAARFAAGTSLLTGIYRTASIYR